jgi:hypothetical protein
MIRAFVLGVILIAAGCERPIVAPETSGPRRVEEFLVFSGFSSTDTVVVGPEGLRVGLYHDFSPYDSLRIVFSAERLDPGTQSVHILVRIGPANYFRDTLVARQKEIAIHVDCALLAKPQSSALTFYAADPSGRLLLAHLRVMGWSPY